MRPTLEQTERIANSPGNGVGVPSDGGKSGRNFALEKPPEGSPLTLTDKVGEAKTRLSELLAKVEAGEEVVIARGHEPIARLTRVLKADDFAALVAEVKAAHAKRAKTTLEELVSWRDEGRRF